MESLATHRGHTFSATPNVGLFKSPSQTATLWRYRYLGRMTSLFQKVTAFVRTLPPKVRSYFMNGPLLSSEYECTTKLQPVAAGWLPAARPNDFATLLHLVCVLISDWRICWTSLKRSLLRSNVLSNSSRFSSGRRVMACSNLGFRKQYYLIRFFHIFLFFISFIPLLWL